MFWSRENIVTAMDCTYFILYIYTYVCYYSHVNSWLIAQNCVFIVELIYTIAN